MINNVVLVGRLTKDVEVKKTQSGLSVASFTVACDRRLSQEQRNNNEQSADFISCVAWRGSADFLGQYSHKGDTVGIEGAMIVTDKGFMLLKLLLILYQSCIAHSQDKHRHKLSHSNRHRTQPLHKQMIQWKIILTDTVI